MRLVSLVAMGEFCFSDFWFYCACYRMGSIANSSFSAVPFPKSRLACLPALVSSFFVLAFFLLFGCFESRPPQSPATQTGEKQFVRSWINALVEATETRLSFVSAVGVFAVFSPASPRCASTSRFRPPQRLSLIGGAGTTTREKQRGREESITTFLRPLGGSCERKWHSIPGRISRRNPS